jgi:light-regulated signal transduction histidine kinase (bacteriophytochrome)
MLAATLDRFPALRDLRVQFAALAAVVALPFVAGAAYDIWFALQATPSAIHAGPRSDVIEVRIGGLAIALIVSGLLAVLFLQRMMPSYGNGTAARESAPRDLRALNALLERRVAARTRDLERSIRELESYTQVISSNLRAPLGAIAACATLIERHHRAGLDAEGSALFARMRGNAVLMDGMVDGLIDFARLARRRLVVQPVEMTDVVRTAIEGLHLGMLDEERIQVERLPAVPADASLFALAWRHLIDNALKFSAAARDRKVRIEGEVRHGVAEFRVSDRGAGFDPLQAGRLFGLFERLHDEEEFPGVGVGLAIVKRIVERHGGVVWAEGEPGKGATFGFSLPLGLPAEAPAANSPA